MFKWLKSKTKSDAGAKLDALPFDPEKRLKAAMACQRAISLVDSGQREEALALFQQAVVADPGYGLAWSDMGICLNELGRYSQAADAFAKACELEPNDFASWFQRATACAAIGRNTEARECLAQARRLHPGHSGVAELERSLG